jgi:hypothetical protein
MEEASAPIDAQRPKEKQIVCGGTFLALLVLPLLGANGDL